MNDTTSKVVRITISGLAGFAIAILILLASSALQGELATMTITELTDKFSDTGAILLFVMSGCVCVGLGATTWGISPAPHPPYFR